MERITFTPAEEEVRRDLERFGPSRPLQIAQRLGKTEMATRMLLSKMWREGKLSKPERGVYAEPEGDAQYLPNPLPAMLALRRPDLLPFPLFATPEGDVRIIVRAMRDAAEHHAGDLQARVVKELRASADRLEKLLPESKPPVPRPTST